MNGKFRVWDKKVNEFSPRMFLFGQDGSLWEFFGCKDKFIKVDKSNYIIEHYTGLTDKNGKEIFEGDICNLGNNHRITIIFKDAGFGWLDFPNSKHANMISFSGHNYLREVMRDIEIV